MGPTIWPQPKPAVISATGRRASPTVSWRAPTMPSAVRPMNEPPTHTAATRVPIASSHSTLASTPTASTRQTAAKARNTSMRRATHSHSATDGAAARPNTTQIDASSGWSCGEPRTSATMKVAVMT